jgi:hypothetical protein
MYKINPQCKIQLDNVGHEKTPVIIIDDFMSDITTVIKSAINEDYIGGQEHNNYYPGVRAPVGNEYGMTLLKALAPLFYNIFKVPKTLTLRPQNGSFSLLTQQEKQMSLAQCLPHFDNTLMFSFAAMHYLNPGSFGGTGLYRHKPTGYENINAARKEHYMTAAQDFIDNNGNPEQKYFTHSTNHYELIKLIEYKPNRLVIYPSTLLHSAFITNPKRDICNEPKTGRLTANFFIEFTK